MDVNYNQDCLHFFAARLPKNTLTKFHYACKLYGKKKCRCTEEALEMFSDMIIADYHEKQRAKTSFKAV